MTVRDLYNALRCMVVVIPDAPVSIGTADKQHYTGDVLSVVYEDEIVWLETDEFGVKGRDELDEVVEEAFNHPMKWNER